MGRGWDGAVTCVVVVALRTELRREGARVVDAPAVPFWCAASICVGFPPGTGGGGLYASAKEPLVGFCLFVLGSSPVRRSKDDAKEEVDDGARCRARADGLCGTGGRGLGFACVGGTVSFAWMGSQDNEEEVELLLGGGGGGRVF